MNTNLYDAIIVGGGPSGLTSAIYLARSQARVLLIEKDDFGGQIAITNEVVNYPGIYKTSGKELTEIMRNQAQAFGAEFLISEVTDLDLDSDIKKVYTERGTFEALSIILATGANPRKIGFKGEEEFAGRGIAYCATCDGEFYTGKEVLVIGGGFAAAEEAVFLTKYANHVHMIIREEDFTCAKSTADAAKNHPKISIQYESELKEVRGTDSVMEAVIVDNKTGEESVYTASNGKNIGVFVFAGYIPETKLVKGKINLDKQGYVVTSDSQKTSKEGVFASGDLCIKDLRQVATATSDGAIAATQVEKYILEMHKKLDIAPKVPEDVLKLAQSTKEKYISKPSSKEDKKTYEQSSNTGSLDKEIVEQLQTVFSKLTKKLTLKVYKNSMPISKELEEMMKEISETSDMLDYKLVEKNESIDEIPESERPVVKIVDQEGKSPLAFHGVPGGHEFQSFILGIYNFGSKGQEVSDGIISEIKSLKPTKIQIIASLSCTQCPDLVVAAQRLATLTNNISVDVYDIAHFETYKEKYDIMSVPCIIFNDGEKVAFGKKNIKSLVDLIKEI